MRGEKIMKMLKSRKTGIFDKYFYISFIVGTVLFYLLYVLLVKATIPMDVYIDGIKHTIPRECYFLGTLSSCYTANLKFAFTMFAAIVVIGMVGKFFTEKLVSRI